MTPSRRKSKNQQPARLLLFLVLCCIFTILFSSTLLVNLQETARRQESSSDSVWQDGSDEDWQTTSVQRLQTMQRRDQKPAIVFGDSVGNNMTQRYGFLQNISQRYQNAYYQRYKNAYQNMSHRYRPGMVMQRLQEEKMQQHRNVSMQQCLFDLVVTMYQGTTNESSSCAGFLIRDDAVLTSHECARDSSLVHVVGYDQRQVESVVNDAAGSLAIVKLRLPPNSRDGPEYHPNSGWPRQRIFLGGSGHNDTGSTSRNNTSGNSTTVSLGTVRFVLECSETERRPTLSVHQRDDSGELVPITLIGSGSDQDSESIFTKEIQNMLQEENERGALVEMRNEKGERWWIPKENATTQSQTISDWVAKHSQKPMANALSVGEACGIGAVLELEDPKGGRKYSCLKKYFEYWANQEPFSGEPFFQWLDYGSGQYMELGSCSRSKLNDKRLHFYNETERNNSRIDWLLGENETVQLRYSNSGVPVPEGKWLFVWGLNQELYVMQGERNVQGHMSFFDGEPVLFAGEIAVCGGLGLLVALSSKSGHYRPPLNHTQIFFQYLSEKGVLPRGIMETEKNQTETPQVAWTLVSFSLQQDQPINQTRICPQLSRSKKPRKTRDKGYKNIVIY